MSIHAEVQDIIASQDSKIVYLYCLPYIVHKKSLHYIV
jgi:hypothetical protein